MTSPNEESTEPRPRPAGTEVRLNYFRFGGKWYAEGTYQSSLNPERPWEIEDEVRTMLAAGRLPGLMKNAREFIVLCEIRRNDSDYFNIPRLIYLPALRTILLGAEELLG